MLGTPRGASSWDYIIAGNERQFIWDDHGTEVEQWNKLAGRGAGLGEVESHFEDGEVLFFTYGGRSVRVPHVDGPDDNAISIHMLSQLVKADSELRWCVDSRGNSDHAYLALAPADWRLLEKQFGQSTVSSRFMPLPESLEQFWAEHDRKYKELADANKASIWKRRLSGFLRRYWIFLVLLGLVAVAICFSEPAPRHP
ncbi:MAG: hypothetical protein JWR07_3378 [Nevskia sp.]|nr:hypothetical protein [Nevskia sp.]